MCSVDIRRVSLKIFENSSTLHVIYETKKLHSILLEVKNSSTFSLMIQTKVIIENAVGDREKYITGNYIRALQKYCTFTKLLVVKDCDKT